MKNTKRVVAFCLVLVLAIGVLSGCGKKASNYEVLVTDSSGKPVSGAMIQFCSDAACNMGTTDENGLAVFEQTAGKYTVHVLKVPENFAADNTEYLAPAEPGRLTITLK